MLRTEHRGSVSGRGTDFPFFTTPTYPDSLWGPFSFLHNWHGGSFPG